MNKDKGLGSSVGSKRDAGGSAAKTTVVEWNGQQPAVLVPLIGRKIERAWVYGETLALLLEGGKFLRINAEREIRAVVVAFEIWTVNPSHGAGLIADLDAHIPQNPHTYEITGMTFTGADADVVMFASKRFISDYGARVTPTGIEWVKAACPDSSAST